jgi:predicted transcriptional regulator
MTQTLLEMTKDLTRTLVETGNLSAEDMQVTLQKIHATLSALEMQEDPGGATTLPVTDPSARDWRKSISKHTITCMECGIAYKQLPHRHLQMHGLDLRAYRKKYGMPLTQPLSARATTARRRQVVQAIQPWVKSPMYRKSQARNGHPALDSKAETVPDETTAPVAVSPAHPKGQRKTTRKKQTTRKKNSPVSLTTS